MHAHRQSLHSSLHFPDRRMHRRLACPFIGAPLPRRWLTLCCCGRAASAAIEQRGILACRRTTRYAAIEIAMKLPSDYFEIVANGARVLHALGVQLRARAEKRPEAPELWLAVRDLDGLAGRLADNRSEQRRVGKECR